MFKQRFLCVIIGLALTLALTGGYGLVAETLGISVVPQAYACSNGDSSGGGC